MKLTLPTLLLCLCAAVAFGQPRGAALLLPLAAVTNVQTNKQKMLYWDSNESQFNIYIGSNRTSLVKRATVASNSFPVSNAVYAVSAVNAAGVESTMAYWPSNRVGALVEQSSTNLTAWRDERTIETFTNRPNRPAMYLRIVDRTTAWLPPN